jgi:hypothetical protein
VRKEKKRALQPIDVAHPDVGIIQRVMDLRHVLTPVICSVDVYHAAATGEQFVQTRPAFSTNPDRAIDGSDGY